MNENEWKVVWPLGTIWPLAPHIARQWSVVLPVSRIWGYIEWPEREPLTVAHKEKKSHLTTTDTVGVPHANGRLALGEEKEEKWRMGRRRRRRRRSGGWKKEERDKPHCALSQDTLSLACRLLTTAVFPVRPLPSPPATSFRVLVQRGVDLTWQPPIRCSAHPIQYSYSRPAFSDASRGGSSPGRCATRSYHVSPSFRCSVVLCPPCCCPTYPALFVTLGNALPAVLLSDLPCSLCYTPHFRPPAVVAIRQVCAGAKMRAISRAVTCVRAAAKMRTNFGAVARFGATAGRGSALGTRAFALTPRGCQPLSSLATRELEKFRQSKAGGDRSFTTSTLHSQEKLELKGEKLEEKLEKLEVKRDKAHAAAANSAATAKDKEYEEEKEKAATAQIDSTTAQIVSTTALVNSTTALVNAITEKMTAITEKMTGDVQGIGESRSTTSVRAHSPAQRTSMPAPPTASRDQNSHQSRVCLGSTSVHAHLSSTHPSRSPARTALQSSSSSPYHVEPAMCGWKGW